MEYLRREQTLTLFVIPLICDPLTPPFPLCSNLSQPSLQSTAAWALSHLAKGSETSARPFAEAGLFPVLATRLRDAVSGLSFVRLAYSMDDSIRMHVHRAL